MVQETAEVFLYFLAISHPTLPDVLRFVNNMENITSGGYEYFGCPFKIALPDERDDGVPPQVQLEVDNVHREIVIALRTITSAPRIDLSVALAATPDTLEVGPIPFILRNATYDATTVRGTLWLDDILGEPFPAGTMDPPRFPGLF